MKWIRMHSLPYRVFDGCRSMLHISFLAAQGNIPLILWLPSSYIARICRGYLVLNIATSGTSVSQEA